MNDDKLDKLLNEAKANESQSRFGSIAQFKANFFNATQKVETVHKSSKALWWFGGAAAAVTALIMINFGLSSLNTPREKSSPCPNTDFETFRLSALAKKVNEFFPEANISLWFADNELKTTEALEPGKRNVLISYVLECFDNRKKSIQILLITANNNNSRLGSKNTDGSIWVYSPDNKMVAVDTFLELKFDNGPKVKIEQSNLLEFNKGRIENIFVSNGKKYRLIQTAQRI